MAGMRDLDQQPYSADEQRVVAYLVERGLGGGDNPIGFILASHAYLVVHNHVLKDALKEVRATVPLDAHLKEVVDEAIEVG